MYYFELLFQGFVLMSAGYFAYLSCMVSDAEKKQRRKDMEAGTHDYYGNKICDSNDKIV